MSAARAAVLAGSLAAIAAGACGQDNPIDDRVRASFEAAESFQGPLDGGWTLVDATGAPIYAFQLVDKVGGRSPLEGVFRDLRHPSVPGDIGLVDGLERGAGTLTLRFGLVTIRLRRADAGWVGKMGDGATATAVLLNRDSPPP